MSGFHGGHSSSNNSGFHGGHSSSSSSSSHNSYSSSSNYSSSSSSSSVTDSFSSSDYSYGEIDPDSRPSFFFIFSMLSVGLLLGVGFLISVGVCQIPLWPIAITCLMQYVVFTFFIMPTSHLFRSVSGEKFDFEKDKEIFDRLKEDKRDNKNGTRYLIISGSSGIAVGFLMLILNITKEPQSIPWLALFIFFSVLYLLLGIIIRSKFLATLEYVKDKNNDGVVDEDDLMLYHEEQEEKKKEMEEIRPRRSVTVYRCPYCGKRIAKKALECKYCGAHVKEEK